MGPKFKKTASTLATAASVRVKESQI